MERARPCLRRGVDRLAPWLPLVALVLLLAEAVRWGLAPLSAVRATLAIAVLHILPGAILWRLVRPPRGSWVEDVVLGAAVGAVLGITAQAMASSLGLPVLTWVIPLAAGVAPLAAPWSRTRVLNRRARHLPTSWGPALATLSLLLVAPLQGFFRQVPLTWDDGFRTTYVDLPFNLALAGELAHRGPETMPHVVGESLNYHWFAHAWVAHVSQAAGVGLDEVMYRIMPVVLGVLVLVAVASVAVRVSDVAWVGILASLIAVASADFGVFGLHGGVSILNPLSPTLALSTLIVLGLVATLTLRWRGQAGWGSGVLVIALGFAAAGTKGSALPVVLAGVGLTLVLGRFDNRRERGLVALDLLLLTICLGAAFALLFSGETHNLSLDPVAAMRALPATNAVLAGGEDPGGLALLVAAVLVVAWSLVRAAGFLGVLTDRTSRRDPVLLMLLGAGLAGTCAVLLLSHPGKSQIYFLRSAIPVMSIGAAFGFFALWKRLDADRNLTVVTGATIAFVVALFIFRGPSSDSPSHAVLRLVIISVIVLVGGALGARMVEQRSSVVPSVALTVATALTVLTIAPTLSRTTFEPAPVPHEPAAPEDRDVFSRDQIDAARWLRDHSGVDDLVATNRHCTSPPEWVRCDSRRFSVTAYTERRVLVEGWAYTSSWAASPEVDEHPAYKPFWDEELLALNDSAFQEPTPERLDRLREQGVRWLYVDKTAPFDLALRGLANSRLETKWAWVLELR